MNSTYQFLMTASGASGMKVSRLCAGRTIRVFVSRTGSTAADMNACRRYLTGIAANGSGPNFTDGENRQMMEAAAAELRHMNATNVAPAAAEPSPEPVAVAAEPVSHEEQFAEFHGLARGITMGAGSPQLQEIRWTMLRDLAATVTHLYLLASIVDYCHRHAIEEDYQLDREFGFTCKCGIVVKDEGQLCGSCASDAVMYNFGGAR